MTTGTGVTRFLKTFFDHQQLCLATVERRQHRSQSRDRAVTGIGLLYQFSGELKFMFALDALLNGTGLL